MQACLPAILTDGLVYYLYCLHPNQKSEEVLIEKIEDERAILYRSEPLFLDLQRGVLFSECGVQVKKIVGRLVQLLIDAKRALSD